MPVISKHLKVAILNFWESLERVSCFEYNEAESIFNEGGEYKVKFTIFYGTQESNIGYAHHEQDSSACFIR